MKNVLNFVIRISVLLRPVLKSAGFVVLGFVIWNLWFVVLATLWFVVLGPEDANAATISKPMQSLGLVGYWSFDVGKGAAKAVDMSGRGKTKNRLAAVLGGLNLVLPVLPTDISIGASAKSVKNSLWIS